MARRYGRCRRAIPVGPRGPHSPARFVDAPVSSREIDRDDDQPAPAHQALLGAPGGALLGDVGSILLTQWGCGVPTAPEAPVRTFF